MFIQDPTDFLDYTIDWSAWLTAGDSVVSAVWTAPTGITVAASPAPSITSTTAKCWITGGTAATTYAVGCHMTTTGGRQDEQILYIEISPGVSAGARTLLVPAIAP